MHLCLRFYDPNVTEGEKGTDPGRILVDGIDLKDLHVATYHRHIGVVSQDTQLFGGTILENITYGMEPGDYSVDDVIYAAKQANAHDYIIGLDEGYQTKVRYLSFFKYRDRVCVCWGGGGTNIAHTIAKVGDRGMRLSGGQRQRIAIARVFLRKPKILFLDEATSALDTVSEAEVQLAIDRLIAQGGCTVVLVAHRLSTGKPLLDPTPFVCVEVEP